MTPTPKEVAPHTGRFLDRMEQEELAIVRRAYAKHVLANADVDDARVEEAFAAVRREHFLGPGPGPMLRWPHRYEPTPSDDPVYLYQDALVGIIPERSRNNGQPWLHAMLIAAAARGGLKSAARYHAGRSHPLSSQSNARIGPQGSKPIAAAISKNSRTSKRRSPPSYFAT